MNTKNIIHVGIAAALLYFIFNGKKTKRRGSLIIPPLDADRKKYTMTAGSVLYDNRELTKTMGTVFRGGEIVWLLVDYDNVMLVDYRLPTGEVRTGYVKKIDIRK